MAFQLLKSVLGRRFGISSTNGLLAGSGSATAFDLVAVMRDSTGAVISPHYEPITAASSSGATLSNSGVSLLSSATAESRVFQLQAPVAGVLKEIISQASATTVTFETSATTILFFDTTLTDTGSTGLVLTVLSTDGGNYGAAVVLRGLSATRWQILSKPKSSSAAA